MEKAALLAKRSLLRHLGEPNADPAWAAVEARLLSRINALDIGPAGMGGGTTAMGVHIDTYPTHIAGLPVAINIGCHVTRHASAVVGEPTSVHVQGTAPRQAAAQAPAISGKRLQLPLSKADIEDLRAGEMVSLSGPIYTARDAAHKRLVEMLDRGEAAPFDMQGQAVYYAGPSPAKPGKVIGSVGPTTSGRMDKYSSQLISAGLRVMIGKGERSQEVIDSVVANSGTYLVAIGGAAAYMAQCITDSELVAFEDLGTEAIRRLTVKDFPAIVAIDAHGNTIAD